MGLGKGADLKVVTVVLKFCAIVFCMVGFGLVDQDDSKMSGILSSDNRRSEDFMLIACTCYLITLLLMIIFQLVKGEFDRMLTLWFLFSGAAILIGAGGFYGGAIANCEGMISPFKTVDYAACGLAIVAGILLLADGIITYKNVTVAVTEV